MDPESPTYLSASKFVWRMLTDAGWPVPYRPVSALRDPGVFCRGKRAETGRPGAVSHQQCALSCWPRDGGRSDCIGHRECRPDADLSRRVCRGCAVLAAAGTADAASATGGGRRGRIHARGHTGDRHCAAAATVGHSERSHHEETPATKAGRERTQVPDLAAHGEDAEDSSAAQLPPADRNSVAAGSLTTRALREGEARARRIGKGGSQ